jgi:hypothetical protein
MPYCRVQEPHSDGNQIISEAIASETRFEEHVCKKKPALLNVQ